jgi:multiple sugar transport system permease protein
MGAAPSRSASLYLLPAVALLGAVLALPLAATFPAAVRHLPEVARDPSLGQITRNTLIFTGVSVSIELVLGVLFALILHERFRGRGAVRAIALLPWALPTAVMAMAWRWIFNDTYGVAVDLPVRLGLADATVPWLGRPAGAFAALVLADVWKTTPFVTILALAGLQSIPRDLYEAIAIDGAGPVRRFIWVTLPLLRPAIALALVFRIIHAIGIFDLVWVLTGGGPANATKTIAVYIYEQTFQFGQIGYGAALTVLTAAAMLALALAVSAVVRGRPAV